MILDFVDHDLLNSRLVDGRTGQIQYRIATRASYAKGEGNGLVLVTSRHTTISDASDATVAHIEWTGEEKKSGGFVSILGEEAVNFASLLCGHAPMADSSNQLIIPTRRGYEWVATRDHLKVRSAADKANVMEYEQRSAFNKRVEASGEHGDRIILKDLEERDRVELLAGFIFVNLIRRTRFNLPKYQFALVDTCHETRQSTPTVLSHLKGTLSGFRSMRRPTA